MDMIKTGEFIAAKRNDLNYTQQDLAKKVGVDEKDVCAWEKGEKCPDVPTMNKIAMALDITLAQLLDGK